MSLTGNFFWHFYLHAFFGIMTFISISTFRIHKQERNAMFWKSCGLMLSNWHVLCFFIVVWMTGVAYGTISTFLFIYLESIGGNDFLLGSSLAVTVTTEVVFFWYSERVIARFGEKILLYISLGAYILRFIYYSFLTNPWAVYPAELLHGLTYACMWSASVSYAHSISPPGN